MAVGSIAGILGAIVAIEGIMAVLEHMEGDPEADVEMALKALTTRTRRRAFALEAGEQLGREDIQERFAGFHQIPQRALTQASMIGSAPAGVRAGVPPDTTLLDFVTARLGASAGDLRGASAPRRMGDLSGALRSAGRTPPG